MSYSYGQKPPRQPGRPTYLPPYQRPTHIPDQTSSRIGVRQHNYHHRTNPNQYDTVLQNFNQMKLTEHEQQETTNTGINFDAYEDIPVEITGSDVPKPVNTFSEIDLGHVLNDNIKNRCKYVKPTPIQRHAIPVALAGRDLMACAQTGSGKTAAFCFPIISGVMKTTSSLPSYGRRETVAFPLALVLSPTRELCCQIFEEAKKFCFQTGVKVAVVYGGAPVYPQLRNLERGVDILVATPGRLTDMIERSKVSLAKIKYLALDEADRMLDMGFEPQIRKIVERLDMPPCGRRQTMLFSATFPTEIQRMASDFLKNYIFLSVGRVGSSTDLILQKIVFVEDSEKRDYLRNLLHDQKAKGNLGKNALTLIFVETKRSADSLENWLCRMGFPATAIHGDKVQFERERALRSFKNGATPILVATDVASRGLDIPRVAHVINFDLPRDIDSYVHRIGRTGRAGKSGLATAFFNAKNSIVAKPISELMKEAHQDAPGWLDQYAESHSSSSDYRRGSSKFGGRDFRSGNDGSYGNEDYGTTAAYGGNADYGGTSYGGYDDYAPPIVAAGVSDSYGGFGGGGGGYSGWD
ncbi:putative RNA helicase [Helianthus annuus]|uniref:RNA helicase n=1 Tax=Helianthus annuus TaxID=4232 RepID=A0A251TSQ1_HELAN|nr:DEAD-box ATP-dependent RNA helicase 37 [Helianthus annuus]KAF5788346.1 putative RNA helicase [Helianthus annuus]KAJ0698427.1 putative RNA helicase [Helianthus annuus]KAJ0701777.1 putative RNA helicase [Helianthus annuus]KAJ0885583.1 putative RNA helicase [Helianthus annuus]